MRAPARQPRAAHLRCRPPRRAADVDGFFVAAGAAAGRGLAFDHRATGGRAGAVRVGAGGATVAGVPPRACAAAAACAARNAASPPITRSRVTAGAAAIPDRTCLEMPDATHASVISTPSRGVVPPSNGGFASPLRGRAGPSV